MRLLLDTHVVIAVAEGRRLGLDSEIRFLLESPDADPHASIASLWEIGIKARLGKLPLRIGLEQLPDVLQSYGARLLPIQAAHVLVELDPLPATRDPFDRLLLAQCAVEGLRLVTRDRALADHPLAWRSV